MKNRFLIPASLAAGAAMLVAAGAAMPAAAQDAADFYRGKTAEIIISYGPGGSYDLYGKLAARHIGNFIPGKPTVIARNMPGAGGLNGANHVYNVAARDGTAMGVINQNAALGQALDTGGIKYDVRRFAWIGRFASNNEVFYTWHTAGARSLETALQRELIAGGTGPTSSSVVMPRAMNQLLGTRFRVVAGYKGSADISLAMERGEVHGQVRPWAQIKGQSAALLKEKKLDLLVQYTTERHPDIANVPTIVELAGTEEARAVFRLLVSGADIGRALVAPPALPAGRVATLRGAFDAMVKDAAFRAEAEKSTLEVD
ncbi:MAG: hypothetical protein RL477_1816, partial [Pseudomonadota bacterium]